MEITDQTDTSRSHTNGNLHLKVFRTSAIFSDMTPVVLDEFWTVLKRTTTQPCSRRDHPQPGPLRFRQDPRVAANVDKPHPCVMPFLLPPFPLTSHHHHFIFFVWNFGRAAGLCFTHFTEDQRQLQCLNQPSWNPQGAARMDATMFYVFGSPHTVLVPHT